MGVALDLMLLLGITKEGIQLAPRLPQHVWAAFVIVLPFCLGMGGAFRSERALYVSNYVRVLIGQALTLATTIIYVSMLSASGLDAAFVSLFAVVVVFYGLGRLFGMTLRSLLLLACLGLALTWVWAG